MSIKRLSGAGLTTPKSNKLWDQVTFQSGMFALATVSLTSTASSIVFDSIPANYTHLQLRAIHRTATATGDSDPFYIRFNSDSGSNYAFSFVQGYVGASSSTSTQGVAGTTAMTIGYTASANNSDYMYGVTITDILDYTNTNKFTSVKTINGNDFNNDGSGARYYASRLFSGLWKNTAAVTSISITPPNGGFVANSHFALYGIKVT